MLATLPRAGHNPIGPPVRLPIVHAEAMTTPSRTLLPLKGSRTSRREAPSSLALNATNYPVQWVFLFKASTPTEPLERHAFQRQTEHCS